MKNKIIICFITVIMCLLLVGCVKEEPTPASTADPIDDSTYVYGEDDDIYGDNYEEEFDYEGETEEYE